MAARESFTKEDIRTVMKFQFLQGKTPPEMSRGLQQVFNESAPSDRAVRRWFEHFEDGRVSVEDGPRSGRPSTATSEDIVKKVEELLMRDRRQTCEELANDADVSIGSVYTIFTQQAEVFEMGTASAIGG